MKRVCRWLYQNLVRWRLAEQVRFEASDMNEKL